MKRNKIILVAAIITTAALGSTFAYSKVFQKGDNEIKVVGYKSAELSDKNGYETKNGYQISKYEDLEASRWLDDNTLLVLKDDGVYSNPDNDFEKSYISLYDLNTKSCKDYKDLNMATRVSNSVSPSGRYVLYGEPRNVPKMGSEELEKAKDSEELFHRKINILDLETGEIIREFDKTLNNYLAQYSVINDDYIFVDYGMYWKVLDKQGNAVKEGKIEVNSDDVEGGNSWLIDTKELKVEGNDIIGSFYYIKNYVGDYNTTNVGIYSMDISTNKVTLIGKYKNSFGANKQGDVLTTEIYNNNGEPVDGVYDNAISGIRTMDKGGKVLQEFELPRERKVDNLSLSTNGEKCAFVEKDSLVNKDANHMSDTLKIMDVKTGEVKEIVSVKSLIEGIDNADLVKAEKDGISHLVNQDDGGILGLSWDSTGTSLMFNFVYLSKEDDKNHACTYIVTFDK